MRENLRYCPVLSIWPPVDGTKLGFRQDSKKEVIRFAACTKRRKVPNKENEEKLQNIEKYEKNKILKYDMVKKISDIEREREKERGPKKNEKTHSKRR